MFITSLLFYKWLEHLNRFDNTLKISESASVTFAWKSVKSYFISGVYIPIWGVAIWFTIEAYCKCYSALLNAESSCSLVILV